MFLVPVDISQLEVRLRNLEGKDLGRLSGSAKGKPKIEAYDKDKKPGSGGLITPAKVRIVSHSVSFFLFSSNFGFVLEKLVAVCLSFVLGFMMK